MFRKSLLTAVIAAAFVLCLQSAAAAQYAPVSGRVELQKADGTKEPVAGALIEVYRTDIKAGSPASKANKKGEFSFAGLMLGAEYAFAVSGPGCSPQIYPSVKAGQDHIVITMQPGNGAKFTEADVRGGVAAASGAAPGEAGGLTEEQKKQQADYEKLNAEITAKNERMKQGDELARRSNEEGNAAFKAGNYDLAITKYTEGVNAVPDYVGSTPILLSGKMTALKMKGFTLYQEGGKSTDKAGREAKYKEANAVYDDALGSFQTALDVIKNAPASTDPVETKRREGMTLSLYALAVEIHRLKAATKIDTPKSAEAATIIPAYIAMETDADKKLKAQMVFADIMRTSSDFEKAVAGYREILAAHPDNAEAMGKLGLSLFAQGAATDPEDKEKEQEGLNYMQKYTEVAPIAATDTPADKDLKTSIKEAVDYLKSIKMTPQKPPAGKKRS